MRRAPDQAVAAGLGAWFGLSAVIQLNDPDPAGSFAFYAAAALISLLAPHRPWVRRGGMALAVVAVLWALRLVAAGLGPTTPGELLAVTSMKTAGFRPPRAPRPQSSADRRPRCLCT